MAFKVFVDGQEGTTGLKIWERLEARADIDMLRIDPDKRKDAGERRRLLNAADAAILCLPDEAAKESVSLVENDNTRILDASTAHRVAEGWVYGIPEMCAGQYEAIRHSKRVSVPGCYATGFNMIMRPLVDGGIVPRDYPAVCHAMSGYSGGGKKMIAEYEGGWESGRTPALYALTLSHKHLPEIQLHSGLTYAPLFSPSVAGYFSGMNVAVPLHARLLGGADAGSIARALKAHYEGRRFVRVYAPDEASALLENGRLYADNLSGTNLIELCIFGGSDIVMVVARLDNLGKGASGAAVQCLNIMLGLDEGLGLEAQR